MFCGEFGWHEVDKNGHSSDHKRSRNTRYLLELR